VVCSSTDNANVDSVTLVPSSKAIDDINAVSCVQIVDSSFSVDFPDLLHVPLAFYSRATVLMQIYHRRRRRRRRRTARAISLVDTMVVCLGSTCVMGDRGCWTQSGEPASDAFGSFCGEELKNSSLCRRDAAQSSLALPPVMRDDTMPMVRWRWRSSRCIGCMRKR
jgi:hypothetical protein